MNESVAKFDVDEKIDVIVSCGTNSPEYVEFLIWTINSTVLNPDKFRYILGINHQGVDRSRLEALAEIANVQVIDAYSGLGYSSLSHAITLDMLFEHVNARLCMICDADVAFLEPHWDLIYINALNDGNIAFGTEYARDYHTKGSHRKYVGFPNILASMFVTSALRDANISFRPASTIAVDAHDARFYGYDFATTIFRDTGWELSYKLRQKGYTGVAMHVLTKDDIGAKFLRDSTCVIRANEFQHCGVPIVTHLGRSSSRKFGRDAIALSWEKRVRNWLAVRHV